MSEGFFLLTIISAKTSLAIFPDIVPLVIKLINSLNVSGETGLLDNNKFSGNIPLVLAGMTPLKELFLSHNELENDIPEGIGNLTNLIRLGLDQNKLTGSVPAGFSELTNLTELFINNNQLSGEIPAGIGEFPNLNTFYINTNNFVFEDFDTSFLDTSVFGYNPHGNPQLDQFQRKA